MKKVGWVLEVVVVVLFSMPLAVLPLGLALKTGDMLGLLLFHIWGSRRRIAVENLLKSVSAGGLQIPEPAEAVIKSNFRNLGRSLVEVIKIYYGLGDRIIQSIRIEGLEHFKEAKSKGRGVVLLAGHCGNWELLAIAASAKLSGISIIARPINNPFVNRLVERVRRKYGNEVIYKKGALKDMIRRLKNNEYVGILMDQAVIPEEGYVIDFLGRGAWTTKMPAIIARKTGAAVIAGFIHRTASGHVITISPEIALSENGGKEEAVIEDTKNFSGQIENYIREHPTEWLWIHRRWKRVQPR